MVVQFPCRSFRVAEVRFDQWRGFAGAPALTTDRNNRRGLRAGGVRHRTVDAKNDETGTLGSGVREGEADFSPSGADMDGQSGSGNNGSVAFLSSAWRRCVTLFRARFGECGPVSRDRRDARFVFERFWSTEVLDFDFDLGANSLSRAGER